MTIPTESIGSIPRKRELIEAIGQGVPDIQLDMLYQTSLQETIELLEQTGSPVLTDGEQTKSSFATYPLEGFTLLSPNGVVIPFADGHTRQLPMLKSGPFRYTHYADQYLKQAQQYTRLPLKQAIISSSALSLLYPAEGIEGYSREAFLSDLLNEHETDIRRCLEAGAYKVQIDFTEGRLALKLDPSGNLLQQFIDLNNQVLSRFSEAERSKLGVHACPGGDHDSTHSADVYYKDFLPKLFELKVKSFYLQLASEPNRKQVLATIQHYLKPSQVVFVGVIDVLNPEVETPGQVRDRILEAADYIPISQLGTTYDCGFSPFCDDISTIRETAFSKIAARIEGTKLAEAALATQQHA